jgi:hypothetical protein
MSPVPAFSSAADAMAAVRAGLRLVAAADATQMSVQSQAECLQMMEQADAVLTAARASVLSTFTTGQGYCQDADYSPRAWLMHKTGITRAAAASHTAWARRAAEHRLVMAALAEGEVSPSYGRAICQWTDRLPAECREAADEILVTAAKAGMALRDMASLAAEMYERSRPDLPDEDPGRAFEDRAVRLDTTFQGAGVLNGDLTPECSAIVGTVLDALSAPAGAEDTRTHGQQYHDGLLEAMRRLAASDLLPERAGQPVKVWVHVSMADLMLLDGSSALLDEWTAQVRAQWAARRAEASESGGDGGAWLDGDAAETITCDAAMAPVVVGEVNAAAPDDLVRLCVELDRHRRDAAPEADTSQAWEALERAVIGKAVDLLSGPGGLASFLRRRQLGVRLGGPSLPLDIGFSATIPAGIRHAVILRDRHCRWPGGCDQPAAACQVHHVRHKANGGHTSLKDCVLLCSFHHQVAIHRWGWTLALNPDGTTTAWNKDKTKVLHSHGPPVRPG